MIKANLLDWMLDHGENWHGLRQGKDASLAMVYVNTVEGLVKAGVMVTDMHFRQQVLRVLGKMDGELEQIDLAREVLQYCDEHQRDDVQNTLHLVENVRDVVERDGWHNCHPLIWLYVRKMLSDVYIQADRYDEADAVAVQTLQEVAELRRPDCNEGKWNLRGIRDKGMAIALAHLLAIVESNAYLKRAAVSNHFGRLNAALTYMDKATAVLDLREDTDRLYPEMREGIQSLRLATLEALPLEEIEGGWS